MHNPLQPSDHGVTARIADSYRVEIDAGGAGSHRIVADEPGALGGKDEGPGPFELLYASVASCVLITIRMYASRKGWPLESAELRVVPKRTPPGPLESARLELTLHGPLTQDQRERILHIAGRCPVHRTLESPVEIETVEVPSHVP